VAFKCDCSKERFAESLMALPKHEVQAMIDEDHGAEAVCHFCGDKYQFSVAELQAVLSRSHGDA